MADAGAISTIAGIISTFGVAVLVFRIQRELQMQEAGELNWIPWSDWLSVAATLVSLLLVLLPLLAVNRTSKLAPLPPAASAAACILVAGYLPGILAHYRFILGGKRSGPRINPEPAERVIVRLTATIAIVVGIAVFTLRGRGGAS